MCSRAALASLGAHGESYARAATAPTAPLPCTSAPNRGGRQDLTARWLRMGDEEAHRMSMAFLRDDAEGEMPRRHYNLPDRDDPGYDRAAARALLEATRVDETQLAERATGYYWGEPKLRPYAEEIRLEAERTGDERMEQLARRFQRTVVRNG